jgi:hypothetical protein
VRRQPRRAATVLFTEEAISRRAGVTGVLGGDHGTHVGAAARHERRSRDHLDGDLFDTLGYNLLFVSMMLVLRA